MKCNAFSCSAFNAQFGEIRAVRGPATRTRRRRVSYETLHSRANCSIIGLSRLEKASKALEIRISVSREVLGIMVVVVKMRFKIDRLIDRLS